MACAIVLQGWAGWPLAVRMAGEAAADIEATIVLCTATRSEHPPSHGEHDDPPAPDHRHQTCLICQGGLGPLYLLAAWWPPLSGVAETPRDDTRPDHPPAQLAVAAYAPRAPPLNA